MRTITEQQRRAYRSAGGRDHIRVIINNASEPVIWTNLDGSDLISSVEWGESVDDPGQTATIQLAWRLDDDNASPYQTGSRWTGNLELRRRVLIQVATLPSDQPVTSGDWVTVFDGQIDSFNLASYPATITCRDRIVAQLMDRWIEQDTTYADPTTSIQNVMQSIMTAHAGSPAQTLNVAASPGFNINPYNQEPMPIFQALQELVFLIGWDLRPRWVSAFNEFRLTLSEPDRTTTTTQHTIFADEIFDYTDAGISIDDVRNVVRVVYTDGTLTQGGQLVTKEVVRSDSASITKYGRRWFELTEGSSSQIDTQGEAEALADAVLADLAEPRLSCSLDVPLWWPVEIGDYYLLEADAQRWGADQQLAVIGYRHVVDSSGAAITSLTLTGKPRSGHRQWLEREGRSGVAPNTSSATPKTPATPGGASFPGLACVMAPWPSASQEQMIEIHRGSTFNFTPSDATLVQLQRARRFCDPVPPSPPGQGDYYRIRYVDALGNAGAASASIQVRADYIPPTYLLPALRGVVQVRKTSTQSISSGGDVKITWQEEDQDPGGLWDAVDHQYRCPRTGVYDWDLDMLLQGDAVTGATIKIKDDLGATIFDSGTIAISDPVTYRQRRLLTLTADRVYFVTGSRATGTLEVRTSKLILLSTLA